MTERVWDRFLTDEDKAHLARSQHHPIGFGEKPALISASGQQTSFRTFATRVQHLVGGLRALGLKEGSRVAILSRNRPEFVEAICAAAGGFIAVPLNWRLSQEEIALILRDCQPDALLVEGWFLGMEAALRSALGPSASVISLDVKSEGCSSYEELIKEGAPASLDEDLDPERTACIVYTSGTTGRPKGAELTHRGVLLNCRSAIDDVLHLYQHDLRLRVEDMRRLGLVINIGLMGNGRSPLRRWISTYFGTTCSPRSRQDARRSFTPALKQLPCCRRSSANGLPTCILCLP